MIARLDRKKSNWMVSQRFSEMQTAKAWHLIPSEWDALDDTDKAQMMALEMTEGEMREYEDHQMEKDRMRKEAARGAKGKR